MLSKRSPHVVFFYSPGWSSSTAIEPSGLLLKYYCVFLLLCVTGRGVGVVVVRSWKQQTQEQRGEAEGVGYVWSWAGQWRAPAEQLHPNPRSVLSNPLVWLRDGHWEWQGMAWDGMAWHEMGWHGSVLPLPRKPWEGRMQTAAGRTTTLGISLGFPEGFKDMEGSGFMISGFPLPEHSGMILPWQPSAWKGECWDVKGKHLGLKRHVGLPGLSRLSLKKSSEILDYTFLIWTGTTCLQSHT